MVKIFCERIQYLRKRNNKTRANIAKVVNVSSTTIYRWEKGLRSPKITYAIKLADYFCVSLDYLLGLKNEPNKTTNQKINQQ